MVPAGVSSLWWLRLPVRGLSNRSLSPCSSSSATIVRLNLQFQLPERLAQGTFDLWGSSRQIFHVAILGAFHVHVITLTEAFTALPSSDFCELQANHQRKL
jgi:predicted membrane channel-forming protein YqfA (hemolysin III family)